MNLPMLTQTKKAPKGFDIYADKNYLSILKPAPKYSLFKREILVMEISFGQTASHAPVKVQEPKPSLSIWATMFKARVFLSGWPCGNKARWETFAERNNMADEFLHAATQAPQPIQEAAAKESSALSLSIGIAFASTALPVFTEI